MSSSLKKDLKKKFVLDTNVILHDSNSIYQFEDHDIIIPITVLEELDQFKKGNSILNYHARAFLRALDKISGHNLFNGGALIKETGGRISVKLEIGFDEKLMTNFSHDKPDHHILNIAYSLLNENKDDHVVLVTKDVNLRMKAKSVGLMAEDYKTDHVRDVSELYSGHNCIEDLNDDFLDAFFKSDYEPNEEFENEILEKLKPNEYSVLRSLNKSALCKREASRPFLKRIVKNSAYGILPKNAQQTFALDALLDRDIPLVTITGKAGTGKTLLAVAAALEKKRYYRQIFISRPTIPLSNRDIGYLPGDIQSKLDPYMQPIYDNIGVIQNQFSDDDKKHKAVKELLMEEKIIISPLSYIRGRSLVKIFFIVDEAQNLTPHEIKTIITRAGQGAKIVFTGDIFQIDHPYLNAQSNGLSYLIERMAGNHMYSHINLEKGERSELAELAASIL